ncbi:hypothetical protein NMG60_11022195 [Bertholletia excelsa]
MFESMEFVTVASHNPRSSASTTVICENNINDDPTSNDINNLLPYALLSNTPSVAGSNGSGVTLTNNNTRVCTVSSLPASASVSVSGSPATTSSRYENQKRRDWNTFCHYLRNQRPPLPMSLCSGGHVLEFLRYLDQFGKTKVHNHCCPFFGVPNPPGPCPCPLRQAWGSLDSLIGRLRAAFEEHGGKPDSNPFAARSVRLFLREVRDFQAKSRGISYEKKRKRSNNKNPRKLEN